MKTHCGPHAVEQQVSSFSQTQTSRSALSQPGVVCSAQQLPMPMSCPPSLPKGGPLSLIDNRVDGLLCEADPERLADALVELAGAPLLREQLAAK